VVLCRLVVGSPKIVVVGQQRRGRAEPLVASLILRAESGHIRGR
jgi:hypothetical protein